MSNINRRLSDVYSNKENLYLPKKTADQIAKEFKCVTSSQLRKYLSKIKEAKNVAYDDINKAKAIIYTIVPLAAYNCGRDKKTEKLYDFFAEHITPDTIIDKEDIVVLDELYTSIIAYHTLYKGR